MKGDRAAIALCFMSAACALALETFLGSRAWPRLVPLTGTMFAAALAGALINDAVTIAVALAVTYLVPALVLILHGGYQLTFNTLWAGALLGAIAPRTWRSGWAVAAPWRGPLFTWALVVALTWPIVVLREIDWVPALLTNNSVPSSSIGVPPPVAVEWVLGVSVALLAGILLFNWLELRFQGSLDLFKRWIVAPLVASALATIAIGVYQMFGDILFVNTTVFGATGRAAGGMLDGNAFGMAAVLGGLLALAWASSSGRPIAAMIVLPLSWIAAWGSGSRSAFLGVVIAFVFALAGPLADRIPRRRWRAATVAVLVIAFLGILAIGLKRPASGPLRRLHSSISTLGGVKPFVVDLWYRNGYGRAASRMIAAHPWFGVGIGGFHILVPDYPPPGVRRLIPDNAQNWYRHQLAELGILGSLGWMAWVAMFGWCVLVGRAEPSSRVASNAVRAGLLIFAVLSMVGMPGQDIALAITFWVFAFWHSRLTACRSTRVTSTAAPLNRWPIIAAIVVASTIGTAVAARHSLRVPERAIRAGWPYAYGFYDPEAAPGGGVQRWTGRSAAIVITCPSPAIKLTIAVHHADADLHPVHVRVRLDGREVIDSRLHSSFPVVREMDVTRGSRVLLETSVDRVFRPSDAGLADHRELGLLVKWDFVDR